MLLVSLLLVALLAIVLPRLCFVLDAVFNLWDSDRD